MNLFYDQGAPYSTRNQTRLREQSSSFATRILVWNVFRDCSMM